MKKILYSVLALALFASCSESNDTVKNIEEAAVVAVKFDITSGVTSTSAANVPMRTDGEGNFNSNGAPAGVPSITITNTSNAFNKVITYNFIGTGTAQAITMSDLHLGANAFTATAVQNETHEAWLAVTGLPAKLETTADATDKKAYNTAVSTILNALPLYRSFASVQKVQDAVKTPFVNGFYTFDDKDEYVHLHMMNQSAKVLFNFTVTGTEGYSLRIKYSDLTAKALSESSVYLFNSKKFTGKVADKFTVELVKANVVVRTGTVTLPAELKANEVGRVNVAVNTNKVNTTGLFTITWETEFTILDLEDTDVVWE